MAGPWRGENTVGIRRVLPYIFLVKRDRAKYRRRRLGALLVAATFAGALYAGGVAGAEQPPTHYTVAPGDTLWGIALERTALWEDPSERLNVTTCLRGILKGSSQDRGGCGRPRRGVSGRRGRTPKEDRPLRWGDSRQVGRRPWLGRVPRLAGERRTC
jgi:hypothetical protein